MPMFNDSETIGTVSGLEWNSYLRIINALPPGMDPSVIPTPYQARAAWEPATTRAQEGPTNTGHLVLPSLSGTAGTA
ncbi:hypothetical protein MMC28_011402, partial [Mycoblastus sanguinarius]|nr:hypothetical protein [Mycoblastus sanguinarius]